MKVFKFGGASVKDATGIRHLAHLLDAFPKDDILVVVSAMGKTTNALEQVLDRWVQGADHQGPLALLREQHMSVLHAVTAGDGTAQDRLTMAFDALEKYLHQRPADHYDFEYDQVVSHGEIWSTIIVHAHLDAAGIEVHWCDARKILRTDHTYRTARVDWESCQRLADRQLKPLLERRGERPLRVITQGFIGHNEEKFTTTLGREGSDFSAAIFAYLLDAESVTIWKDVPGMFNADPNRFKDTRLLEHISYREAIELSYFGASVIHPRTLQPLQNRSIPLYVRSFEDLQAKGSTIDGVSEHDSLIPSFIIKPGQVLISITPRDLSFIVEEHLSEIFGLFAKRGVRIDLMQNSALAFTISVADGPKVLPLIETLRRAYEVRYNEGCELVTVRHYDEPTLERLIAGKEVLIEQRSRNTARFVLRG